MTLPRNFKTCDLRSALIIVMIAASSLLTSCGPKESDKVGEAQLCMDTAVQGEAAKCLEKIAGIESAAANTLRCSAGFIDEGFTQPARFRQAFDQLSTGGSTNTEGFFSVLSFKSKATSDLNITLANETYGYCVKSGGKGVMLLASMATTATNLAKIAGSISADPAAIQTAIANLVADPASPANAPVVAAIGGAVAATYTATCKSGQQADAALCGQMDAALAGKDLTNSAAIGQALLAYWQAH